ncbi:hypothetical protein RU12_21325 [Salmonella enterica]|nr:hypothetical protein [Salmonella enterica]EBA7186432.1 hypothetical protein [Salmonella enterica]
MNFTSFPNAMGHIIVHFENVWQAGIIAQPSDRVIFNPHSDVIAKTACIALCGDFIKRHRITSGQSVYQFLEHLVKSFFEALKEKYPSLSKMSDHE